MKIDSFFIFRKKIVEVKNDLDFYCCVKNDIKTKEELFYTLDNQFKFTVFGWNWDALNDALCDLEQITQKKIILMHEKIGLDNLTLSIYLSCLVTAVLIWEKNSYKHIFMPIFLEDDKEEIIKILHSASIKEQFDILKGQIHL